jgi:hypothetical protein
MSTALQTKWHRLPIGRPGHRFRNHYYQHQQSRRGRGLGPIILRFFLAALAAVVGFVLVFLPGPAIVFFLISGALLAKDWLPVARLLDWGEVRVRRAWRRMHAFWVKLSVRARIALGAGAVLLCAAGAYGLYCVMR